MKKFFIFCLVIFLGYYLHAQDVTKISKLADKYSFLIPEKYKVYVKMARPSSYVSSAAVATTNAGVAAYNNSIIKASPCIYNLAGHFYSDLVRTEKLFADSRVGRERLKSMYVTNPLLRPETIKLGEAAGEEPFKDLKPGWLWEKAMDYAGGDANLAMQLIGLCGHDNISQGMNFSEGENFFYCPESLMFLPKSLGSEVDLESDLKNQIRDTQKPGKPLNALESKHYHTYYAAYIACENRKKGLSEKDVVESARKVAGFYRRIRVCLVAREEAAVFDKWNKVYQSERAIFVRLQIRTKMEDKIKYIKSILPSAAQTDCDRGPLRNSFLCNLGTQKIRSDQDLAEQIQGFEHRMEEEGITTYFQSDKDIEGGKKKLARMNAARIYLAQSGCPESEFGTKTEAVTTLLGSSNETLTFQRGKSFGCASVIGISGDECTRAQKVLDEWAVDFKWSMAQAEQGAKFAAQKCQPVKDYDSQALTLLDRSCKTADLRRPPPKAKNQLEDFGGTDGPEYEK